VWVCFRWVRCFLVAFFVFFFSALKLVRDRADLCFQGVNEVFSFTFTFSCFYAFFLFVSTFGQNDVRQSGP